MGILWGGSWVQSMLLNWQLIIIIGLAEFLQQKRILLECHVEVLVCLPEAIGGKDEELVALRQGQLRHIWLADQQILCEMSFLQHL